MKIFMLGWEFPPFFAGGVGVVCYQLSKYLSKRGIEVNFVMPSGPKEAESDFVNLIIANNLVSDKNIHIKKIDSLLMPYITSEGYLNLLKNKLMFKDFGSTGEIYGENLFAEIERFKEKLLIIGKNMEFDVIHAHDWVTFPAAVALKEATGKPLIVHIHITEFDKTGGVHADPGVYRIEKTGMDKADVIIAISNFIKNRLTDKYYVDPAKIKVIHNAAEIPEKDYKTSHKINENDKVVLFVGRITLQKGPDYFVEAAKKIVEKEPNVKFVMTGSGDMFPQIINKVAELGLTNKFIFPGFLNREQVFRLYSMADVFIMPSVSEPFGLVPLEAMASKTPAIISKQSGVSEIVGHVIKVDFWDVNDIAAKTLAILKYQTLNNELKKHGSMEVKMLNWDIPAQKCIELYNQLVYH
ncbi:glycosyltransferase family 4 protein [Candidatus Woesearchaeota archaeon]|nr:glycosyltransferase family 4 protein [Candidatus Woesearchaeota archaeon]